MNDGRILAVHCDCMAGLGETCSHAASLFWIIDFGVESRESLTATQKSAYLGNASCYEVSNILSSERYGKKRKNSISVPAAPPSNTELSQFFDSLALLVPT